MPAKTERQRRFMGAVRSAKEGKRPASREVKRAAKSMSMQEVRDMTRKPKRGSGRPRNRRSRRA